MTKGKAIERARLIGISKAKQCVNCDDSYMPTSPSQKYCTKKECQEARQRIEKAKQKAYQRKWYKKNKAKAIRVNKKPVTIIKTNPTVDTLITQFITETQKSVSKTTLLDFLIWLQKKCEK